MNFYYMSHRVFSYTFHILTVLSVARIQVFFVLNQNNWITVTLQPVLFTCVFHVCHIVFNGCLGKLRV